MALITIKDMIADLKEKGCTLTAIAKATDSTPATICRALKGHMNNNLTLYRNVLTLWVMFDHSTTKAVNNE